MTKRRSTQFIHYGAVAALSFLFTSVFASPASADLLGAEVWTEEYDSRSVRQIEMEFVRGEAEITRRPGPITVSIRNVSAPHPDAVVWLDVTEDGDDVSFTDFYPRTSNWHRRECLPPIGPRGNFWYSKARLKVSVFAPASTNISINFMETKANK